ncbi:hypothetical protein C8R45DRAFT_509992 [Mycena sanguinolenta]|nr:hypothetical protein C8R45DRAFT_509992 [Mycena sanguinolenta]
MDAPRSIRRSLHRSLQRVRCRLRSRFALRDARKRLHLRARAEPRCMGRTRRCHRSHALPRAVGSSSAEYFDFGRGGSGTQLTLRLISSIASKYRPDSVSHPRLDFARAGLCCVTRATSPRVPLEAVERGRDLDAGTNDPRLQLQAISILAQLGTVTGRRARAAGYLKSCFHRRWEDVLVGVRVRVRGGRRWRLTSFSVSALAGCTQPGRSP